VQDYSAQKVTTGRPGFTVSPPTPAFGREKGDTTVKLVLAISTLVGSLSLLISDWAGQAFPYL